MWRYIKNNTRKNKHFPFGKCFVSFAYEDFHYIDKIKSILEGYANLFIFPPIKVTPEQMVSNYLLSSIRQSESLIYLFGANSNKSPWVALERDYALRSKLEVYSFNVDTEEILRDNSKPLNLPIFPSYSRSDIYRIDKLLKFMEKKRYFDLFKDSMNLKASVDLGKNIEIEIFNRLKLGGYIVPFLSRNSIESKWVELEVKMAIERFPNQILPVMIDEVNLPDIIKDTNPLKLFRNDSNELDMRRVDDLIVRLYWMIYKNTKNSINFSNLK